MIETLSEEFGVEYLSDLDNFLEQEYKTQTVYPPKEQLFSAFNYLNFEDIQVVIIGQDPYHQANQANGLAFSVSDEVKTPPSLKNIYKELVEDMGCAYPQTNDLSTWASQGVLLMNTIMSVRDSEPASHQNKGWEMFSDSIIKNISAKLEGVVFILWGGHAQKKEKLIDGTKHLLIKSPHPSPLSSYRGFFGSKPFSKSNAYLGSVNKSPIQWCL